MCRSSIRNFVRGAIVSLAALAAMAPSRLVVAEDSAEAQHVTKDPLPIGDVDESWSTMVSEQHEGFRDNLFSLADRADDFFGNERSIERRRDDYFRIGGEVRFRAGTKVRFRQRLRAGIDLSGISDRLKLVAEGSRSDIKEGDATTLDESDNIEIIDDPRRDGARTALRYELLRDSQIDVDVDGGLKFSGGVNPYTRVRASRLFKLSDKWSVEPAQFLLWELDDGFGERTRLDLNRALGEHSFGRLRSELLYSETSRGGEIFEELGAYQEVSERAYFGVVTSMAAYMEPGFAVDEARVGLKYRQSVKWPWLLVEVAPALTFPDDREHRTTPEILFRVDVYFDRARPIDDVLGKNAFGTRKSSPVP